MTALKTIQDNQQPVEPVVRTDGKLLDVHDVFLTIQGEGPFVGRTAVFVRLAGCNLQCTGCDSDYTSKRGGMSVQDVFARVVDLSTRESNVPGVNILVSQLVVLTGGEPFRQSIGPLTRLLLETGYEVQVETNGTLWLEDFPWGLPGLTIVCSPKTHVNKRVAPLIDHLKYVIRHDRLNQFGLPALTLGKYSPDMCFKETGLKSDRVWVTPEDTGDPEENRKNLEACVKTALENGYRVNVQVHKIMGVA